MSGQSQSGDQFVMKIPTNKVGLVISKEGKSIKSMQSQSGARIQVIPFHPPPGDISTERTIQIDDTSEQIESAKQLISEVTSEGTTWVSMGVCSNGWYDVPFDLIYSFSVTCWDGDWRIVRGLSFDKDSKRELDITSAVLNDEKDLADSCLS